MITDYRTVLLRRHEKAKQAKPEAPDKPLTWVQYQNKLNVSAWRERLSAYLQGTKL